MAKAFGWFQNFTIYKFLFMLILMMILTRIFAPDTAGWMRAWIMDMEDWVFYALDFGGSKE